MGFIDRLRLTVHTKEAIIEQINNGFIESTRARGHFKVCFDPAGTGACEHVVAKGHTLTQGRRLDQVGQTVEGNSELIIKKTYKVYDPEDGKRKRLKAETITVDFTAEPPNLALNGGCLAGNCGIAGAWFLHDADTKKGSKKKRHKKKRKHKHKNKHKKS